METIKFDEGDYNWKWAICAIQSIDGTLDPTKFSREWSDWIADQRINGVQTYLTINGKEMSFKSLLTRLMEEFDRMVENTAANLVRDKMDKFSYMLHLMQQQVKELMEDEIATHFPQARRDD
ncbi:hypothetical protein C4565_00610 [Candidatus Parcubacteria bacterium]|nr:MAG: hypothetical protein C4565_00610 [Candidatus Parcubacteria bacterium]